MSEVEQMELRNIKKRYRGKSPTITKLPNGQILVQLKMRKNTKWIHR